MTRTTDGLSATAASVAALTAVITSVGSKVDALDVRVRAVDTSTTAALKAATTAATAATTAATRPPAAPVATAGSKAVDAQLGAIKAAVDALASSSALEARSRGAGDSRSVLVDLKALRTAMDDGHRQAQLAATENVKNAKHLRSVSDACLKVRSSGWVGCPSHTRWRCGNYSPAG
jgi:hypothetical protein